MQVSVTSVIQCITQPFKVIGSAFAKAFRGIVNVAPPQRAGEPKESKDIGHPGDRVAAPVAVTNVGEKPASVNQPVVVLQEPQMAAVPQIQRMDARQAYVAPHSRPRPAEENVQTRPPVPHAVPSPDVSEVSLSGGDVLSQTNTVLRKIENELMPVRYRSLTPSGAPATASEKSQIRASEDIRSTCIVLGKVIRGEDTSVETVRCHLADVLKSGDFNNHPMRQDFEPLLLRCLDDLSSVSEGAVPSLSLVSDASTSKMDVLNAAFEDLRSVRKQLPLSCHIDTNEAAREAGALFSGAAWSLNAGSPDVAAGKISRGIKSLASALMLSRDSGRAVTPTLERIQANLQKFVSIG